MNIIIKKIIAGIAITSMFIPSIVYAVPPTPPGGSESNGGAPGGNNTTNVSYTGSTTFSSDTTASNTEYSSSSSSQNALLVSGGTSNIENVTVIKTGDSSGDESDFYGNNAAILAYNNAILNIKGGTITTNGSHANAVFAYGNSTINISEATIRTTSNNSGGVMVTGGGTLNATDLDVETSGNSSASIRSDRGGGTLNVEGGSYTTSGTGSPTIYSTADITVNNATLKSTSSEGVVVEGANSVILNNVTLTDTNNTLNGNSETYKNIFLYQSMSGDASEGNASFTAKNSTITTNKGDTIFVTNTTATINLENNTIINNDGDFLRIQTGKWGNSGSNGGNVTLNMTKQKIEGNIIVDDSSTLIFNLSNGSVFKGDIDSSNQAKNISVRLSSDSVLVLTSDVYIDSLENELSDNSNIYLNGHKLFVSGVETSANEGVYTGDISSNKSNDTKDNKSTVGNKLLLYGLIGIAVVLVVGIVIVIIKKKRK